MRRGQAHDWLWPVGWVVVLWATSGVLWAQRPPPRVAVVKDIAGEVEYRRAGSQVWMTVESLNPTTRYLHDGDQVRTGDPGRVILQVLGKDTVVRLPKRTTLTVRAPTANRPWHSIFLRGISYFFHRGQPTDVEVISETGTAFIRGTEFVVAADQDRMALTLVDGSVELTNAFGSITLTNGQQGLAERGRRPFITPSIQMLDVVQWFLYYPGVLDVGELEMDAETNHSLAASIVAYQEGDLVAALTAYDRQPQSAAEQVYLAALLLSVGQVQEAEALLTPLLEREEFSRTSLLARALRRLIAIVRSEPLTGSYPPTSATEWMVYSYERQAQHDLEGARRAVEEALLRSLQFGLAWARLAELEFSFGRTRAALRQLNWGLVLAPRNAQAHALRGFLLAAESRIIEATNSFNRAIELDGALGNGWLGRGLGRIRRGDLEGGQEDLLVAAAVEPERAVLRSYLGKAYAEAHEPGRADHELDLAKRMDPNDPTPWLYGALLDREQNRVNESIRELEHSIQLNTNRAVYRSQLLLDEDRAVRSSSLATLYQSAGMDEVAVWEAARAVSYDYANYSAHLFLADSFNALRDPSRFNLRHETVWFNELLLANLLSPVGGTPLAQNISQQEYSRLFERNRVGLSSSTEYRSDGQIRQLASQFGWIGKTAWALDVDYQHNDGVRPNNALDRLEWYTTVKQQLTPSDSLMLLTKYQDYHSGDNFQYYDPADARRHFKFDEFQSPLVVAGYHHQWQPGVHTLLLGGRLENDQRFSDLDVSYPILRRDQMLQSSPPGPISTNLFAAPELDVNHRIELEIYTAEVQQIWENDRNVFLLGGRWQGGHFDTHSRVANPPAGLQPEFDDLPSSIDVRNDFARLALYGYETLKLPHFRLTAGLSYEHLRYPENFRATPIEPGLGTKVRERFNPKLSLVWDPVPWVTVRGIYSRSLGGVSLDQSFRLEPTQLAGFSQDFRTFIPESLVGSVSAPDHEVWGGNLDLKFPTGTYLGLGGNVLGSKVDQTVGSFQFLANHPDFVTNRIRPMSTGQRLRYQEHNVGLTLDQLLAARWSLGLRYSFTHSELETRFPDLPSGLGADSTQKADLQRLRLALRYNGLSGFFGEIRSEWFWQNDSRANLSNGVVAAVPDERLLQLDLSFGYRFPRQRGDIMLGILNLTDEDYRLNPVTPYAALPRERTGYARLRFNF